MTVFSSRWIEPLISIISHLLFDICENVRLKRSTPLMSHPQLFNRIKSHMYVSQTQKPMEPTTRVRSYFDQHIYEPVYNPTSTLYKMIDLVLSQNNVYKVTTNIQLIVYRLKNSERFDQPLIDYVTNTVLTAFSRYIKNKKYEGYNVKYYEEVASTLQMEVDESIKAIAIAQAVYLRLSQTVQAARTSSIYTRQVPPGQIYYQIYNRKSALGEEQISMATNYISQQWANASTFSSKPDSAKPVETKRDLHSAYPVQTYMIKSGYIHVQAVYQSGAKYSPPLDQKTSPSVNNHLSSDMPLVMKLALSQNGVKSDPIMNEKVIKKLKNFNELDEREASYVSDVLLPATRRYSDFKRSYGQYTSTYKVFEEALQNLMPVQPDQVTESDLVVTNIEDKMKYMQKSVESAQQSRVDTNKQYNSSQVANSNTHKSDALVTYISAFLNSYQVLKPTSPHNAKQPPLVAYSPIVYTSPVAKPAVSGLKCHTCVEVFSSFGELLSHINKVHNKNNKTVYIIKYTPPEVVEKYNQATKADFMVARINTEYDVKIQQKLPTVVVNEPKYEEDEEVFEPVYITTQPEPAPQISQSKVIQLCDIPQDSYKMEFIPVEFDAYDAPPCFLFKECIVMTWREPIADIDDEQIPSNGIFDEETKQKLTNLTQMIQNELNQQEMERYKVEQIFTKPVDDLSKAPVHPDKSEPTNLNKSLPTAFKPETSKFIPEYHPLQRPTPLPEPEPPVSQTATDNYRIQDVMKQPRSRCFICSQDYQQNPSSIEDNGDMLKAHFRAVHGWLLAPPRKPGE